ncbi:malonyl-ACP O-methyltransferase BioC [Buttiauxella agrestis]|uniref:Malonyl-[acyl-carrier protein] O-methyltransferase n=1 Tax=Buttiauxella agrestis ATCC 33320 TaxID=1006004 RepID=A0A085GGE0_9ENTR|nr:malonyl-ACP O-methyltransferase BioC [Buttiauxella agrestis]KFC82785.1 BioC family biotin synthesis protein [Buttiauxella agrestis ATCC 33320]
MTRLVNKTAIASAFGRAATTYDSHAQLQRESGTLLAKMIEGREISTVLDAGCGTGWYSRAWREKGCHVTALDLSPAMLKHAALNGCADCYLEGDIEAIALSQKQVSLAWSNLAVQWCSDLRSGLSELYRVTRVGGCVAFTTLAAGSLSELHTAWQAVDEQSHANHFLPFTQIQEACHGWRCSLQIHEITQYYDSVISAMQSLKGTGATHLHDGRKTSLMTRQQLQKLSLAWPQKEGQFPLTWQLVCGVIERD